MSHEVVMIRHAQSTWNAESRFTGWANPPLTALGEREAEQAAKLLADKNTYFDKVYTSVLQRSQQTADIILKGLNQANIDVISDWRLNERHYGSLQGLDKIEMTSDVGEDQVWRWRRSYLEMPPELSIEDSRHPSKDPTYSGIDPSRLPGAENLAMTQERSMEFWRENIVKDLALNKRVLISAHGNTLRAMIMSLSGMTEPEVEKFEIPTGTPILYRFNKDLNALAWEYLD